MNDSRAAEQQLLESVRRTYVTSDSAQDRLIKSLAVRLFTPYLRQRGKGLEFGCCDGFMTNLLAGQLDELTVVDGSAGFIEQARQRTPPGVRFIHSLFEDYITDERFDYVFGTYVLEHVQDPVGFLTRAAELLAENGLLFVVVPNARALSRQLARHMGLIDDLYALTPNDINHGHRRVYDRPLLNREIEAAGLEQVAQGGLLLKLLADFQMDRMIDCGILGDAQMEGLFKMGQEYPELAGSLYSVCARRAS